MSIGKKVAVVVAVLALLFGAVAFAAVFEIIVFDTSYLFDTVFKPILGFFGSSGSGEGMPETQGPNNYTGQPSSGVFAGQWRSPYPCTYYILDDGEKWTEIHAIFYLNLEQEGDKVWSTQGWIEITSYGLAPGYSGGLPPLPPVSHPQVSGAYSGPIPFSGPFGNYEYPGGYFRVTVSGNNLIFEESGGGHYWRTVLTLTQNDPEFNADVLRITELVAPSDYADPGAIVLVRK